jgi:hypothetical protein
MAALAVSKGRDRVNTDLPQGFFRRNADFLRFSILRPLAAMLILCALAGIRQIGLGSDATFSQFSGFHKAAAGRALKEPPRRSAGWRTVDFSRPPDQENRKIACHLDAPLPSVGSNS